MLDGVLSTPTRWRETTYPRQTASSQPEMAMRTSHGTMLADRYQHGANSSALVPTPIVSSSAFSPWLGVSSRSLSRTLAARGATSRFSILPSTRRNASFTWLRSSRACVRFSRHSCCSAWRRSLASSVSVSQRGDVRTLTFVKSGSLKRPRALRRSQEVT